MRVCRCEDQFVGARRAVPYCSAPVLPWRKVTRRAVFLRVLSDKYLQQIIQKPLPHQRWRDVLMVPDQ